MQLVARPGPLPHRADSHGYEVGIGKEVMSRQTVSPYLVGTEGLHLLTKARRTFQGLPAFLLYLSSPPLAPEPSLETFAQLHHVHPTGQMAD